MKSSPVESECIDSAYKFIRNEIVSGRYPPGTALSSRKLAELIGVSRMPVRDALRKLQADGFVTFRSRLGPVVRTIDLEELSGLCGLRLALETYAAGLAALHRTDNELMELKQAFTAMRSIHEQLTKPNDKKTDAQDLVQEDARQDVLFHYVIVAASKNAVVRKEILRLHLVNRIVHPLFYRVTFPLNADELGRRDSAIRSHEEIFQAIAARDPRAAKEAMEKHLQHSVDQCAELLRVYERSRLRNDLDLSAIPSGRNDALSALAG